MAVAMYRNEASDRRIIMKKMHQEARPPAKACGEGTLPPEVARHLKRFQELIVSANSEQLIERDALLHESLIYEGFYEEPCEEDEGDFLYEFDDGEKYLIQ